MSDHPTHKNLTAFLALELSKSNISNRIKEYDDQHCVTLLELIDIVEKLAHQLSFQAECQEHIDAMHNAYAYKRAVKALEKMVPMIQTVASEITFRT